MERALRAAATGMSAMQLNVDIISNNIANVNTVGFKKSTLEFEDLVYKKLRSTHSSGESGGTVPTPVEVGNGVRFTASTKLHLQGPLTQTGNSLDFAINGDGFFQIQMPDGSTANTRDGTFKLDSEGNLVDDKGYFVLPQITVPEDVETLVFRQDGRVEIQLLGEHEFTEIGQLEISRFINKSGLSSIGGNLMVETEASGPPIDVVPGEGGVGTIEQGYTEQSNVDIITEMVAMISAQRAYEVNSKTIQTVDRMFDVANGIKR